jgi:hypothetical protein
MAVWLVAGGFLYQYGLFFQSQLLTLAYRNSKLGVAVVMDVMYTK